MTLFVTNQQVEILYRSVDFPINRMVDTGI